MKKLLSIVLALIMLIALCVPAMAESYGTGNYNSITAVSGTSTSILGDVVIEDRGTLKFGSNSTLNIQNGSLTGNNIFLSVDLFGHDWTDYTINIQSGGKINLSFCKPTGADHFAQILENSGINYKRNDKQIIAPCLHESTRTLTVCNDCGAEIPDHSGSTISEGNMTIVVGVAAAVIFGLGGFILGRRKKA